MRKNNHKTTLSKPPKFVSSKSSKIFFTKQNPTKPHIYDTNINRFIEKSMNRD